MTALRRTTLPVLALAAWLLATGPAAGAHAMLRSSSPAVGAALTRAPRQVVITFTEAPEPTLSTIHVFDVHGRTVSGATTAVMGNPLQLRVPLRGLARGTYTVSWRTVSHDDGHVASGTFTFALNGRRTGTGAARSPATSAAPPPSPSLPLLGMLGLVAMIAAEHAAVGASLQTLLRAGAGRDVARVALAFIPAACATILLAANPGSTRRLWLLGASASLAMLVLALGGHAAAPSSLRPLNLLAQWAHLVAVGVWIGGLAWLLAALYRQDRAVQIVAAVRFSRVATLALAAVAVTGLERALSELGSWHALFGSSFGRVLDLKVLLFGVLVAFGAHHHFRVVPALPHEPDGLAVLRRGLRSELVVAALVLLATASLSQLPPGSATAASTPSPAPAHVQAVGSRPPTAAGSVPAQ